MANNHFAETIDGRTVDFQPAELVRHHLLIVGQTGSGKTTTTLALLNQLQTSDYTTIILDPTGEYSVLPNAVTYRLGENAYLEAGLLTANQLMTALHLPLSDSLREKLGAAVSALRIQKNLRQVDHPYVKIGVAVDKYQSQLTQLGNWSRSFASQLLADQLIEEFVLPYADDRADYTLLGQQYDRAGINQAWGLLTTIRQRMASPAFRVLFDPDPAPGALKTELNFVIKMFLDRRSTHRTLIIDLSALKHYETSQRAVISLLLKNLLATRLAQPHRFPVNVVIDEAHRYLPKDERQLADNGIFQVLREGRKVGLSMTLTTQSPLDLPARLRSQFPNLLLHHLTSPEELTSLAINPQLTLADVSQLRVGEAELLLGGQPAKKIKIMSPKFEN